MPIYNLKNNETGEVEEHFVSISTMEEMVENGDYTIVHLQAPGDLGHRDGVLSKTDDGWKENLKRIQKNAGKRNTIKV